MARKKDPYKLSSPQVYLWRMSLFVILCAFLLFIQFETVADSFMANRAQLLAGRELAREVDAHWARQAAGEEDPIGRGRRRRRPKAKARRAAPAEDKSAQEVLMANLGTVVCKAVLSAVEVIAPFCCSA